MLMFTYATPTLITEVLRLVTLLLTTVTVIMSCTALANRYRVSAYDAYQFQGPRPSTVTTTVAIKQL